MCQHGAWAQARNEMAALLRETRKAVAAALAGTEAQTIVYDGLIEVSGALRDFGNRIACLDALHDEASAAGEARERARRSALRPTEPMMRIVS